MKRILFFLFLLMLNFTLKAQQPITQNLASDSTLLRLGPTYNGILKGGIVLQAYTDTTAANATHIDYYTGALIWSNSDTSIYARFKGSTSQYWVKVTAASMGPGGGAWQVGGNYFSVIPANNWIGTNSPDNFQIATDATVRAYVPLAGFALSNDTSATKIMTWNPTSKAWGYANWNNGGGTPTWQQTLTAGSTLTGNNTITQGGNNITFNDNQSGSFFINNTGEFTVTDNSTYSGFYNIIDLTNSSISIGSSHSDGRLARIISGYNGTTPEIYLSGAASGSASRLYVNRDSIWMQPDEGRINIDSLRAGASTDSVMVWNASNGKVGYRNASAIAAGSVPISGLTAATATNDINNAAYQQDWRWNSLAGTSALKLSSSSTASTNGQRFFYIDLSGTNSNSSVTTTGLTVSNAHQGTGSVNVAGYFAANDGDANYAIIVPTGGGSVGIGTNAPTSLLHVNGVTQMGTAGSTLGQLLISGNTSGTVTIQPAAAAGTYTLTLPTNDGDASQFLQTNGSGVLSFATVSGTLPSIGNQGEILQVSNGAAAWKYDTTTLVTFSAGARFVADTAMFTDSTLYGSFYLDGNDTLVITGLKAVMQGGTSDTLGIQVTYNDSINVTGSNMFTATLPINSTTTGTSPEADDWTGGAAPFKIPPGNWVWMKTPTVVAGRKPYYLSVSIIGYKKRVN